MEAVCTGCSKGIFSFGSYLGDSDILFQFLKGHRLVPASAQNVKVKLLSIMIIFSGVIGKELEVLQQ